MEEESHLAEEYVQEFVLDHLEDVVVKREVTRSVDRSDPNNNTNEESEVAVPGTTVTNVTTRLPSLHAAGGILMPPQMSPSTPHPQLLTPPTHSGDEQVFSQDGGPLAIHHPAMRLAYAPSPARPEMMGYPGTPGTPPDTPPGSNSPESPGPPYPLDHGQPHLMPIAKPEVVDGMWIPHPPVIRQEPLDLRPHCASEALDWSVGQNHPSVIAGSKRMHHYEYDDMVSYGKRVRPCDYQDMDSMSPGTPQGMMGLGKPLSMGGRFDPLVLSDSDNILDDETLTTLTVRDLNKKLHGYPREMVAKLKQKRRTLKNRGYAQNCRSKRIQQKQDLETTNTNLRREIERLKAEIQMLKAELHRTGGDREGHMREIRDMRDMYHHRCDGNDELLRRSGPEGQDWGL